MVKALTESKSLRYTTFAALYFAQGLPWGLVTVAYVVFLADHGLSKTDIGQTMGLLYLPWSLKPLVGPLIDRFPTRRFGRRRHFIVAAELLMGATLLLIPSLDPRTDLFLINVALVVHNAFGAIQDVATDGLAVDVLPVEERGKANSVMWAAKGAGSAAGGSLCVLLAKYVGWMVLFVGIAALVWSIMLLVIFVRERPPGPEAERAAEQRMELRVLWRSFAFAAPLVGVAIAMLTPLGYALIGTVYTVLLRSDLKLSSENIAILTGMDTPLGIGGALLGGLCADRFGQRKTMGTFIVGLGLTLLVFAATPSLWPSMSFQIGWTIGFSLCQYAFTAASLGFFMTLSNPAVGATQFAVFMACTNLTYGWTAKAGGWLADNVGIAQTFAIAGVVQIASVLILPFCDQRGAEARFRREAGEAA
jgi:PAT family beta-lactamase induction signal transducer AmpG